MLDGRFGDANIGKGRFRDGRFAGESGGTGPAAVFDPVALFAAGEKGGVWDFGQAAPFGNAIASANDLSGNGNDLLQTTASRQPVLSGVPTAVGPILNADPDFATGTGWVAGTGWLIAGGVATKTAGTGASLTQPVTLTPGRLYVVHVDATRSAGTLKVRLSGGGVNVDGYEFNESRSHTDHLVAAAGNDTLEIVANASFAGEIQSFRIVEATETKFHGAFFNGSDNYLRKGDVDLSGSQQVTIVAAMWRDDKHGNLVPMDVGGFTGAAVPGSVRVLNSNRIDARDSSANVTLTGEGTTPTKDTRVTCMTIAVDYAAADQIRLRQRGTLTATDLATGLTVPDLPAGTPVSVGAAANGALDWRGIMSRMIVINRALSPAEISDAENWVLGGSAIRGAVIGDSTIAANSVTSGQPSETWRAAAFLPEAEFGVADVSLPGHKMFQQLNEWAALSDKSTLDFVIVQIGLNDANTYALTKSSETLIAEMQALIDTVRADVPASCKVYASALTPCRGWIGNSTDPAAAYAHWLAINEAIEGLGTTPITNVDGRIVPKSGGRYWGVLSDSGDYLQQTFDHNGDGVHPNNAGRYLIAEGWRTQLRADGVI